MEIFMDEYVEIKQKNVINNLITFNKNLYKVDSLKETIGTNEFYFILDKSKELNLKPSTLQLFIFILVKASALSLTKEYRTINIPLKDYMELRNISNPVSARRKINQDLSSLLSFHIGFKDRNYNKFSKDKKPVIDTFKMNIFSSYTKFSNGEIQIILNEDFIQLYNTFPKMILSTEIFKIDTHLNPNSFYILWALSYLNNINRNKPERVNNILIRTLLDYCPDIPKNYAEIKKAGQTNQRIINPFMRDMKRLSNIIDWYLVDLNNTKQHLKKISLYQFLELKMHFSFKKSAHNSKIELGKIEETIPTDENTKNEIHPP